MGYSSRYHAASIAAIFLALAIGILIGTGLGDTVVSGTQKQLEESLTGDLEDARSEADKLASRLNDEREFGQRIYPLLVGGKLRGQRVGIVALGGLSGKTSDLIELGLAPTGAEVVQVSVIREPPNLEALAERLRRSAYRNIATDPATLERFGERLGRQLVRGGRVARRTRGQALSRSSGQLGRLEGVVVVRETPDDLEGEEETSVRRLEEGVLMGVRSAGVPAVGVELSDAKSSSVNTFDEQGLSTVDSVDLVSGRASMVFVLLGAEGQFGIKGSADRLLPDLLISD